MKKLALLIAILFVSSFTALSQTGGAAAADASLGKAVLYAPYTNNRFDFVKMTRGCFNLSDFGTACRGDDFLAFGNLRIDNRGSLFELGGRLESQSKVVRLGKHDWNESFKIPVIKPWRALAPGERRKVSIDASGADGRAGSDAAGRSRTDPAAILNRDDRLEVNAGNGRGNNSDSAERRVTKGKWSDGYTPFIKAKQGHMYLVRVKGPDVDYYVLFRVDELIKSDNVTISWKKIDAPEGKLPGMDDRQM